LVGRDDCLRFLGDYRRFWSLEPRSRRRRSRQPNIAPDTFSRQAHEIGFNIPSQRQIRRSKFVRDDTEDGPVVISLRYNQARGHASTLAYCDQILPDHTYLQMGVRLLQFSLSIRDDSRKKPTILWMKFDQDTASRSTSTSLIRLRSKKWLKIMASIFSIKVLNSEGSAAKSER